jgi:peptide deformylase
MLLEHVKGNGIGLAAPQIGRSETVAVMQLDHYEDQGNPEYMTVVINPSLLLRHHAGMCYSTEGCLSIPGENFVVLRCAEVFMNYFDTKGNSHSLTLTGLASIVAQHEYDHLHGILINKAGKRIKPAEEQLA